MRDSPKADTERTSRAGIAALAAISVALLAAGAVATYQASLARAHAVREVVPSSPERPPDALQYLPGSSSQIGTIPEPLMAARRAALRAGFDGDDAPIDAFDRLQSVSGHEEEARTLLAQFWERKAMLADSPVRRVLYALQARVVDDDESRRREVASAIAALGPLRRARHVAEGTILWSDARTLVLRGSGWLHVLNLDTETSFDLAQSDAASALVDAHLMVTWGDAMARVWRLDAAPTAPAASFRLLASEVPLSFSGGCVLTSAGRVWREAAGAEQVADAHRRWVAGSINADLRSRRPEGPRDRSVSTPRQDLDGGALPGPGQAAQGPFRRQVRRDPRRGLRGPGAAVRAAGRGRRRLRVGPRVIATAAALRRRALRRKTFQPGRDAAHVPRVAGQGPALSRGRGRDVDSNRDGAARSHRRLLPGRRHHLRLAPLEGHGRDRPLRRSVPRGASVLGARRGRARMGLDPDACRPGPARSSPTPRRGRANRGTPNSSGSTRRENRSPQRRTRGSANGRTRGCSNTTPRTRPGRGATSSPAPPSIPPWRSATRGNASSVQIDQAFFVESPRAIADRRDRLRATLAVARSAAPGCRALGSPGEALLRPGAARRDHRPRADRRRGGDRRPHVQDRQPARPAAAFEPTGVTGVVAVGPGAVRWISRERESLLLQGTQREPSVVPRAENGVEAQIAFNREGDRFFVRTARSLCNWMIREDGALDLDGCRWSTGGWASDAAWAAADKTGETVVVFDRTAEGAALREFFGSREADVPPAASGDLACDAPPRPSEAPLTRCCGGRSASDTASRTRRPSRRTRAKWCPPRWSRRTPDCDSGGGVRAALRCAGSLRWCLRIPSNAIRREASPRTC